MELSGVPSESFLSMCKKIEEKTNDQLGDIHHWNMTCDKLDFNSDTTRANYTLFVDKQPVTSQLAFIANGVQKGVRTVDKGFNFSIPSCTFDPNGMLLLIYLQPPTDAGFAPSSSM